MVTSSKSPGAFLKSTSEEHESKNETRIRDVNPKLLIIGGGPAGLSSALAASQAGIESYLVESGAVLGGRAADYCCKAVDSCAGCGACLVNDLVRRAKATDRIDILERTRPADLKKVGDGFEVQLIREPSRVKSCSLCRKCIEVCPAKDALVIKGSEIVLNEADCLQFLGESCGKCSEVCPEGAIDLETKGQTLTVNVNAVVPAVGFKPADPLTKPRFGYGNVPGVMTGLELESIIKDDKMESGLKIAFIQCVGSRDLRLGKTWCSRVCCAYALRMAGLLKNKYVSEITVFYMDIQTYNRTPEQSFDEARKQFRMIRSIPSEVAFGDSGKPQVVYHGPEELRVRETFDKVILSVGMWPKERPMMNLLPLTRNVEGFVAGRFDKSAALLEGIFPVGSMTGPMSISEAIADADAVIGEVAVYCLKHNREFVQ